MKLRGFTLIECLIALSLASGFILLIGSTLKLKQHELFATEEIDQNDWQRFKTTLFGDNLELQHVRGRSGSYFYSPVTQKFYYLVCDYSQKIVKLEGDNGGYLPLLYDVEDYELSFQDGWLLIEAVIHHKKYQCSRYILTSS